MPMSASAPEFIPRPQNEVSPSSNVDWGGIKDWPTLMEVWNKAGIRKKKSNGVCGEKKKKEEKKKTISKPTEKDDHDQKYKDLRREATETIESLDIEIRDLKKINDAKAGDLVHFQKYMSKEIHSHREKESTLKKRNVELCTSLEKSEKECEKWIEGAVKFRYLFSKIKDVGLSQSEWIFDCMEDIELPEVSINVLEKYVPTQQTDNTEYVDSDEEEDLIEELTEEASLHSLLLEGDIDAKVEASTLIQRVFRGFWCREKMGKQFLSKNVITIQRIWRGFSSRGIQFTDIKWNAQNNTYVLPFYDPSRNFPKLSLFRGLPYLKILNGSMEEKRGIKLVNTTDEPIRIYWLNGRRVKDIGEARERYYQISEKPVEVSPHTSVNYRVIVSHCFLIQYGESKWEYGFHREVIEGDTDHRFIRIPLNIKSGSAFDLSSGVTVDPETWKSRVENYPNPAFKNTFKLERYHFAEPDDELISNEWKCSYCESFNCKGALNCWSCFRDNEEDWDAGDRGRQRALHESWPLGTTGD